MSSVDNSEDIRAFLIAEKPILKIEDATMDGYRRLQDQEWDLRVTTFIELPDLVAVWIHYFDLYEHAIEARNADAAETTPTTQEEGYALQLQSRLFALTGGTGKLLLDAACAGLYYQAYALCRHLAESWITIAYVLARPDMAIRWFDERSDDPSHEPPKKSTMRNEIRKNARTKHMIEVLEMVHSNIGRYDELSHPGPKTLEQTMTPQENRIQVGGHFNRRLAIGALHEGAGAFRILLEVWREIVPQSEEWTAHLRQTVERHRLATDRYTSGYAQ